MPKFSNISKAHLITCHDDLQIICTQAIAVMDFTVLCGWRGEEEQNELYRQGKSNAMFGQSKHNFLKSKAVDLAPYPIDWDNKERFARLAGIIEAIAYKNDIKIKWGGDFKSIVDMPHFELM